MSEHPPTPSDQVPEGSPRPDFAPPAWAGEPTRILPGPGQFDGPEPTVVMPQPGGTTTQPTDSVLPAPPAAPPRKARSRTVMIAVVSVFAVLAVLVAGDRVANSVAQNTLANALQSELSTPTKPDVSIGGFPFVTQLLGGSFSSVQVRADDATLEDGDHSVKIGHLDATLTDITATDRYANIVAGRGDATAVVDWDSISSLAGQQVSYVAEDRLRVDFSVPIGRLSIDGYLTGRPELDVEAQTITVADPQVNLASVDVPQAVVDAVARTVLQPYQLHNLPYDIQVTDLAIQPAGISLSGNGQDIPLRGR